MDIKVIILAVAISVVALSGCVGTKPEITTNSSILVLSNATAPQNAFKTMISSDQYGFSTTVITIVGNLTDIRYNDPNKDVLIAIKDVLMFEDGTIISTYGAKNFQWKLGKIHLIVIKDIEVKKVIISE